MYYQRADTIGALAIRSKRQRARHSETRIVFNPKNGVHPVMKRELFDYLLMSILSVYTLRKMKRVLHVLLRYLGRRVVKTVAGRLMRPGIAAN